MLTVRLRHLPGSFTAPRGAASSKTIGEIVVTPKAAAMLRGAMVPIAAYRIPSGRPAEGSRCTRLRRHRLCRACGSRNGTSRHHRAAGRTGRRHGGYRFVAGSSNCGPSACRRRHAHRVAGSAQRIPLLAGRGQRQRDARRSPWRTGTESAHGGCIPRSHQRNLILNFIVCIDLPLRPRR